MRPRPALRRAPVAPVSHLDIVPVVITWSDGRREPATYKDVQRLAAEYGRGAFTFELDLER